MYNYSVFDEIRLSQDAHLMAHVPRPAITFGRRFGWWLYSPTEDRT
jgi:hypothetical protein